LPAPEVTNGRGSAKRWRPCTPAMAAGLTDHVWSLKEVLLYRVPPWPQPQTVCGMARIDDREGGQVTCAHMPVKRLGRGVENVL